MVVSGYSHFRSALRYGLAAITAWCITLSPVQAQEQSYVPVIAAASDLQFVLEEIATAFAAETGQRVRLSLGSTGNFARQIREGAPFDIFMAADEQFVLDLHADGFTQDTGTLYGLGRIVLMAPHGALAVDPALDGLREALAQGQITRFAIANPEHAPYGLRAREALVTAGLWDQVRPHLVLGANVSQAAAFAMSGNAEGGIIALSLALAPQLDGRGDFALIPEQWHSPLRQSMVLLPGAGPVAEAFYDYLQQPAARATFARFGFTLPQE
ncbi:MAG: molybdate ABC transporter substrate-binding protein [Roseinatronobacter sp.]